MAFHSSRGRFFTSVMLLVLLFVTGCQNLPTNTPTTQQPTSAEDLTAQVTESPITQTEEDVAPVETEALLTAEPTLAPTLADWREAPIAPEISERVKEIYSDGQAQGRDPSHFSVIGDCQSIPYVFMGPYGRGDLAPDASESYLWNAIEYFETSFDRWSVTARGGFTAASILNALQADPEECKPGETPLTCEFRLNNPAFVLITLETWLDPETIDRYEVYLREIIETVIEKGAVPILITKADSSELRGEKHVINPVIVNLAYEYQVPVVNFWKSAQYLPNYGIDPEREGFHLSQAGYNLKNTLALRALYTVWTAVEGMENEAAAGDSNPTAEVPVDEEVLTPEVTLLDCVGGCVFFGTAQSEDGTVTSQGVYAYNVESQVLTQVLSQGFDLQDVSPDGTQLLVNAENHLFTLNLTDGSTELVSDSFMFYGEQGAYWNTAGSEPIYLDQSNPISTENGEAFNLFPSPQTDGLIFESGNCTSKDYCESEGVFFRDSEGNISQLTGYQQPIYSPDGSRIAFLDPTDATSENYYHIDRLLAEETSLGSASRRILFFPAEPGFMVYPDVEDYAFSPDSSQLLILYNVYSEYYEKSLKLQTYLWDLDIGILYDFGVLEGVSGSLNPRFTWSPDGQKLLFFLTELTDEGEYIIRVYTTDLETGEKLTLTGDPLFTGENYFYITNLYWR
jgi:hypothetical protein